VDKDQRTRITLQREPSEAGHARRQVAQACEGLARDVVEIAQLLTTELVTNAIDHGAGEITLDITRASQDLRVDVSDAAPGRPQAAAATPDQTRGRGMLIVESLASSWGITPPSDSRRKSVWFKLRTAGGNRSRG
jgi:anti-sigma regulatory factor (Ser/Thr protein kinase)